MFLERELLIAQELILRAGELALCMRNRLNISYKPRGLGPVTNADIAIDNYLSSELFKAFPEDRIISEEDGVESRREIGPGRVWFVDPIDGTATYMVGNDDYVVMIGLAVDGIARLGMIYQPSSQTLWRAVIDPDHNDTFADTKNATHKARITISTIPRPLSLTLIASRTRKSMRQTEMIKRIKPTHIVYRSSIGLKAMVIVEGGADFYVAWSNRIALWDTCAPAAILSAAGGHVSFVDGTPLNFMGEVNHQKPVLFAHFQPDENFFAQLKDIASM